MPEVLHPVVAQVLPVAVFLLAITVTAEIAQLAGVFDVAAHAMARRARHRVRAAVADSSRPSPSSARSC